MSSPLSSVPRYKLTQSPVTKLISKRKRNRIFFLMKELKDLIMSGTDCKLIGIHGSSHFVNKIKYGAEHNLIYTSTKSFLKRYYTKLEHTCCFYKYFTSPSISDSWLQPCIPSSSISHRAALCNSKPNDLTVLNYNGKNFIFKSSWISVTDWS